MNKMSYLRHIIQNFDAMPLPHLVRFDWAMKRLLRHKSNFVVLEGFLSSLFEGKITIRKVKATKRNLPTNSIVLTFWLKTAKEN